MEEACTFIVSNFLRCKGRNNIVKCKNILLLNKTVRKVFLFGRLRGRLQNARTQHTAKAIDYQNNQLCQRCEPHGQETLAKCSDVKSNFRLFEQPYGFYLEE